MSNPTLQNVGTDANPVLLFMDGKLMLECCCNCTCCCDTEAPIQFQPCFSLTVIKVHASPSDAGGFDCLEGMTFELPFWKTEVVNSNKTCWWRNTFWLGNSRESTLTFTAAVTERRNQETDEPQALSCVNVSAEVTGCEDCSQRLFMADPDAMFTLANHDSCNTMYPEEPPEEIAEMYTDTDACRCDPKCWGEANYGATLTLSDPKPENGIHPNDGNDWTNFFLLNLVHLTGVVNFTPVADAPCTFQTEDPRFVNATYRSWNGVQYVYRPCNVTVETTADIMVGNPDPLPDGYVWIGTPAYLTPACVPFGIGEGRQLIAQYRRQDGTGPTYGVTVDAKWSLQRHDSCETLTQFELPELPCPTVPDVNECEVEGDLVDEDGDGDPTNEPACGPPLHNINIWNESARVTRGTPPQWWSACFPEDPIPEDIYRCDPDDPDLCLCGCVEVEIQLRDIDAALQDAPDGARITVVHNIRGIEYRIPYTRAVISDGSAGNPCEVWSPDIPTLRINICHDQPNICTEAHVNSIIDALEHTAEVECDTHGAGPGPVPGLVTYLLKFYERSETRDGTEGPCRQHYYWIQAVPCFDSEGDCGTDSCEPGDPNFFVFCDDMPDVKTIFLHEGACYTIDPSGTKIYELAPGDIVVPVGEVFPSCEECCDQTEGRCDKHRYAANIGCCYYSKNYLELELNVDFGEEDQDAGLAEYLNGIHNICYDGPGYQYVAWRRPVSSHVNALMWSRTDLLDSPLGTITREFNVYKNVQITKNYFEGRVALTYPYVKNPSDPQEDWVVEHATQAIYFQHADSRVYNLQTDHEPHPSDPDGPTSDCCSSLFAVSQSWNLGTVFDQEINETRDFQATFDISVKNNKCCYCCGECQIDDTAGTCNTEEENEQNSIYIVGGSKPCDCCSNDDEFLGRNRNYNSAGCDYLVDATMQFMIEGLPLSWDRRFRYKHLKQNSVRNICLRPFGSNSNDYATASVINYSKFSGTLKRTSCFKFTGALETTFTRNVSPETLSNDIKEVVAYDYFFSCLYTSCVGYVWASVSIEVTTTEVILWYTIKFNNNPNIATTCTASYCPEDFEELNLDSFETNKYQSAEDAESQPGWSVKCNATLSDCLAAGRPQKCDDPHTDRGCDERYDPITTRSSSCAASCDQIRFSEHTVEIRTPEYRDWEFCPNVSQTYGTYTSNMEIDVQDCEVPAP